MNVTILSPDGLSVVEQTIDHGDGTGTHTVFGSGGEVVSVNDVTGLPIEPAHHPLDPHGQLVTLLVVVGALALDDAEHVAGPDVTADDLVAEAQAWSVGS